MLTFSLRGGPEAAHEARDRLAAGGCPLPAAISNVLPLLLTELVTNAVKHGGAQNGELVRVAVTRSPVGLVVAVTDPGAGFAWRERRPDRDAGSGGYGLLLVDRIAQRWGIEREQDSTTVWFELSQPGSSAKRSRGEASIAASE